MSITRTGASALARAGGMGGGVGALGIGAASAAVGGILGGEKEKGWWIPDGFMAVRTRFGRAVIRKNGEPVVHGPGFHPNMPGTHANKFISVQDRVCSLGQVAIKREDRLTVVHAEATWGIRRTPEDVHAAWLRVKAGELDQRFTSIFGNAFNLVMSCVPVEHLEDVGSKIRWDGESRNELDELIAQKRQRVQEIKDMTAEVAADELATIGAEIRWLSIRSDAPHPFTQIGANAIAGSVAAVEGEVASVVSIAGA